ncbi:MAG: response regulator [Candidatus Brocadiae bacterium]|nr:response regulator [Candidatus Brocadiia bacterium]
MKKETIKMLLVEDDPAHIDLVMRGMESSSKKFEVSIAYSIQEAKDSIKKSKPDIVISDYLLPDGRGDELVAFANRAFPSVIITSYGNPKMAVEILKAGAMDYVVKSPEMFLDMHHIAERVLREWQNILDKKKAEEEKKILEEKLRRAERMESLGVMAGGIAHDLNNILGPMLMLPEIIKEEVQFLSRQISLENSELKALVSNIDRDITLIEHNTKRAIKVIKDLLAMSRRGRYEFQPLSVNTLISSSIKDPEFIVLRRDKPRIEVETRMQDDLPCIAASSIHFQRVLYNLYINSFDAMDIEGKISIFTRRAFLENPYIAYEPISAGDYVVIEIRDNGSGIKKENLSRMFEPFFSTKKQSRKSGSGLGLSVVHGIVKDHNGFIDVWSEEGKGTIFSLYFPALEEKIEANPLESTKRMVRGGTESILLVDDEAGQLFIAKRALSMYGYNIEEAANGEEAIKKIQQRQQNPFAMVLLDMMMGTMDGLETYSKIQSISSAIKVLIVSAHFAPEMIRVFFEKGISWLAKPYTKESLALAVRKTLDGEKA